MRLYHGLAISLILPYLAAAQTWCGKNYMKGSPAVPPGGNFVMPGTSSAPLLNFQCAPAIKPYLAGEDGSLIIDATITNFRIPGAAAIKDARSTKPLSVSVTLNGQKRILGSVAINSTGTEFPISLKSLTPRKKAYTVTCTATHSGQTFTSTSQLLYLPQQTKGSVTKQDFRTGALLVKSGSAWEPFFALGFYTSFDNYLSNVSNVDAVKARGMNIVHPVPTFDNMTAFKLALDRMEELGLWLMYDMRFTYMNTTSVTEQVNMIKDRPNLLLWYTGDEPDGTSDPLNATKIAKDLINDLDGGGYHPVSLVLNCQDYFFADYALGADVLMQDAYPLGINATFSTVWGTPCTPDLGDCGCDNCNGNFLDISTRMDQFAQRLELLGRTRKTTLWTVPQAFGPESYWPRPPTGKEWLVESILGINHGAFGVVPWDDPTTPDIMVASSALAAAVPQIISFLGVPKVRVTRFQQGAVDVAVWTLPNGKKSLLLAANANQANVSVVLTGITSGSATEILNSGATLTSRPGGAVLGLEALGTTGWVFQQNVKIQMAQAT